MSTGTDAGLQLFGDVTTTPRDVVRSALYTLTTAQMTDGPVGDGKGEGDGGEMRPALTHPLELHAAIYWSVFVGVVMLTFGSLFMFYRCVASHYSDVSHRLTYYDYETLQPSRCSLALNILLYRHRPLVVETVKILWLISISVCLVLKFDRTSLIFMLIVWCISDLFICIAGIYYAIVESQVLRRRSQHATSIAKYLIAIYSVMFGFPIGIVTKLLTLFWMHGMLSFSLPFTLASCSVAATAFAMLVTAFVMFIRALLRDNPVSAAYRRNLYCLVLCGLVGLLWAYLYSCLAQCSLVSTDPVPAYMKALGCTFWSQYWGSSLLPITLPMLVASAALSTKMVCTGMVFRFLPEILMAWSVTVAAHVSAFQLDVESEAYYNYFVLQIVVLLFIIMILLVFYNVYMVVMTYEVWKAICGRQMDRLVDLLHLTMTERNLYFGAEDQEDRQIRRLGTLKKSVLQKLYEKMDKYSTIRAFFHNTLRENIRKYGDVSQCAICFEDYTENPAKVVLGVSKVCGHYFHFDCVWKWLEQRPSCPLCRDPVTLEKGDLRAITYELVQKATIAPGNTDADADADAKEGEKKEGSTGEHGNKDVEDGGATTNSPAGASGATSASTPPIAQRSSHTSQEEEARPSRKSSSSSNAGSRLGVDNEGATLAEVHVEPRGVSDSRGALEGEGSPGTGETWRGMVLPRVQARRAPSRVRRHSEQSRRSYDDYPVDPHPPSALFNPLPRRTSVSSPLHTAFSTCTICRQHYAGNSAEIIVGFIPECGHFFHYACVQRALEHNSQCPQCAKKIETRGSRGGSPPSAPSAAMPSSSSAAASRERAHYARTVTMGQVRFAFLIDAMCMSRRSRSQ